MNELDVCVCGDYRKNHLDGKGLCKLCSYGGVIELRCTGFRLAAASKVKTIMVESQLALDLACDVNYTIW